MIEKAHVSMMDLLIKDTENYIDLIADELGTNREAALVEICHQHRLWRRQKETEHLPENKEWIHD